MGFFDYLQKKGVGAIQAQKVQIRKVERKPSAVKPSSLPASKSTPSRTTLVSKATVARRSTSSASTPVRDPKPRSKSTSRKRNASEQTLCSSSDDSDTDQLLDFRLRKRAKVSASAEPDPQRFQLMVPRDNDGFKPLDDIVQVIEIVSQNYIPEEHVPLFDEESNGLLRRLRRALVQGSLANFLDGIKHYNETIKRLRLDGSISQHLDSLHMLRLPLVERILTQVYSRTVSPRVDSLRQYVNGSDNVYGELLPRLISKIFAETRLKSDQTFVDLGSGVGNVVLQAALEIGCESWGCEVMQNACDLAELQEKEFKTRCRLWGLAPGKTRLIRGSFLESDSIGKILHKADVVLINNQAFTPELNNKLVNYFLDMKEGCQIVSLKSFVPPGHRIQARNLNSPINLLSVKEKQYWSDSVSWTNAGGRYYIATKDSSR
ncbi:conserved hypothetical protein [Uncinocarpus reesii 1704]|uniref:Histone-lysine N-methyltransferase, H3 lysine-79 specific n=1 Tax=Uncinocarpus reesii (strain UAMH 1704) TaxID=336963 RepID=C4JRG7_UNCRE|nr:uncharacterized protein UREG_05056 [Uncinocarpus reesii 1704]EEP80214.1 conserved hypothetical protein [Uncinocarpus reesii 1704]